MIKKVNVTIEGTSPLLMHRFPLEEVRNFNKMTPEEQAEVAAYRADGPDSSLVCPGVNIQRAVIAGAAYSKGKGRSTLAKPVAACVQVTPENVDLGVKTYVIDRRAVVNPTTKGRIVAHRPRLDAWSMSFVVEYNDDLLSASQLREVVENTGTMVGLLAFRPEKKGPFGRFTVSDWQPQ